MFILFRGFILATTLVMLSFPAYAGEVSKEQIKSLDEQVQDIKAETLSLGAQMRLLEERLLYPSSTQVAVFVSLDSEAKYRLGSVESRLDGKPVAQRLCIKRARSIAEGRGAAYLCRQHQFRRARSAGARERQNAGRTRSPPDGRFQVQQG